MTDFLIAGPSTISVVVFSLALQHRDSPVWAVAMDAYDVCRQWGVDPNVALGFLVHESNAGTLGVAQKSRNWGNLREGKRAHLYRDGFAYYTNWLSGLDDFCDLLRGSLYEKSGLLTVSQVTPRYAPSQDQNDPVEYAVAVNVMCANWQDLSGL